MEQEEWQKQKIISELMEQHGQSIYRLVYTYVKDRHTTEDLTQDIFLKCYQKLDQFSNQSTYSTWIYRIAVNHCKDFLKLSSLRKAKQVLFGQQSQKREQTPEEQFIDKSNQMELLELVLSLPEKYRGPVYLHYIEDKSITEIMEILNLSKNTLYTRLRRGLDKLKKQYERTEGWKLYGYPKGLEGNR